MVGSYVRTEAHRKHQSELKKGKPGRPATPAFLEMIHKPKSAEHRKKMSQHKTTPEHNKKVSESLKKYKKTPEHKKKISESVKKLFVDPTKHPMWKGGNRRAAYPREFNKALKLKIRTRDDFTCCLCDKTELDEMLEFNQVLCVNHIDYNKNNCSEQNLNTLCLRCNFRVNGNREFWTDFFRNGP